MNSKHLKILIVETLSELPEKYRTDEAVDLLMLTAAQESHMGEYLYQIGGGPARGVFQIEPDTCNDLIKNFIAYTPSLYEYLWNFKSSSSNNLTELAGNIPHQITVARLEYWRHPEKLPVKTSYGDEYEYIEALAKYWKKWWNTSAGKGTVNEAIGNYHKYVH